MAILLNTFASQIICALGLPLLFISQKLFFFNEKEKIPEVDLVYNIESSRINLFRISVLYMTIFMFKVSYW